MKVCVLVAESTKVFLMVSLLLGMGLSACDRSCEATCRKVLKCEDVPSNELSIGECNAECVRQGEYYELNDDEAGAEAFSAHKQCLNTSSCDEILAAVCYDDELFGF